MRADFGSGNQRAASRRGMCSRGALPCRNYELYGLCKVSAHIQRQHVVLALDGAKAPEVVDAVVGAVAAGVAGRKGREGEEDAGDACIVGRDDDAASGQVQGR